MGKDESYISGKLVVGLCSLAIVGIVAFMLLMPIYGVWQQEQAGKATLARAEYSKRVAIEEAKALKESAVYKAEAEEERAKGVAKANQIIGDSLKDNDDYLRYLWIQGLQDGTSEVIYIPTEAGLPILEAGRAVEKTEVV